jgi:hypothetical protein
MLILARLRILQLRHFLRATWRDPLFLPVVAGGFFVVALGGRQILDTEPRSPLPRFAYEALGAGALFVFLTGLVVRLEGEGLDQGPFHILLAKRGRLETWRMTQSAVLFFVVVVIVSLGLCASDALRVPAFCAAALTGASLAAAGLSEAGRFTRAVAPTKTGAKDGRRRRSLNGPFLIARLQWRRPPGQLDALSIAGAIFLLGCAAARLAIRNNHDFNIGSGVLAVTGGGAGLVLAHIDVPLLRFQAREPTSLMRLFWDFCGWAPIAALMIIGTVGLIAGLSIEFSALISLCVAVLMLMYSALIFLHALGPSQRFPVFAAGLELGIMATLATLFAPLAVVWATGRGVLLVTSARRLRWTDS